jgi:tetratricopeptide (TPR) repeat protein
MSAIRAAIDKALADARKAIALAPDMSESHQALARAYENLLEFPRAKEEHERAVALGPNNARALRNYGAFATAMGRGDSGLTSFRRAVVLDPLNVFTHSGLGGSLLYLRRYPEAIAAFNDAQALDSSTHDSYSADIGRVYFLLGEFENARSACEKRPEDDINQVCLAMSYDKLGRHADAEAMLAKVRASDGDTAVLQYSLVYAQWGDTARALDSLETAMRLRSPDLMLLKHPLYDPVRNEPRFQAIERALKFPPD